MAAIHWLNPISDGFTNAADWSGGVTPGAFDDAILDAAGVAFTVTSTVAQTVQSIQLSANARLSITSGTFDATNGTGAGANAGYISVTAGTFEVGGTVTNSGKISLVKSSSTMIMGAGVTLAGGGVILADGTMAVNANGVTITNADNTITGYGNLFNQTVDAATLVNGAQGVIEAKFGKTNKSTIMGQTTKAGQISLQIINNGVLEADAGTLIVENSNISGSGHIVAGASGIVEFLTAGAISGQLISIAQSGEVVLGAGPVDYTGLLSDAGVLLVLPGAPVAFSVRGTATLAGGGMLDFGLSKRVIGGDGGTFYNVDSLIGGEVDLGNGQIDVVNEANGTIQGSAATLIDCGVGTFTNAGHVVASATSMVTIVSAVNNAGTIADFGGHVALESSLLNDGLLSVTLGRLKAFGPVSGAGAVEIKGGRAAFYSSFSEDVAFGRRGSLVLGKSQDYTGTISGFSQSGGTSLILRDIAFVNSAEASFSGGASGGVLTVTDGAHTANITLQGDFLGEAFVAASDGHKGVVVIAQAAPLGSAPIHAFVTAMAAVSRPPGGVAGVHETTVVHAPMLARPGTLGS